MSAKVSKNFLFLCRVYPIASHILGWYVCNSKMKVDKAESDEVTKDKAKAACPPLGQPQDELDAVSNQYVADDDKVKK